MFYVDVLMDKLAAAKQEGNRFERGAASSARVVGKVKRFFTGLGSGHVSRKEMGVLQKQIKSTEPKSKKQQLLERLSGRAWTSKQYIRNAGIGAGAQIIGSAIGNVIEKKPVFAPKNAIRTLARQAVLGSIYASAIPAGRRLADIEAAKRGKY